MPLSLVFLLGLLVSQPAAPSSAASSPPTASIPDATPVHLAIALRVAHPSKLDDFRQAQKDSGSAEYQHFLTPQEFGRRFGPSALAYRKVCDWLRDAGFTVTEFPNRIFIEGAGTAAQVTKLLGIRLQGVEGQPVSIHVPDGAYHLPRSLAPLILHVSGLDTRVRYRHHVARKTLHDPGPNQAGRGRVAFESQRSRRPTSATAATGEAMYRLPTVQVALIGRGNFD